MLYDVELGCATFKHLGIKDYKLAATASGHPAIVVRPRSIAGFQFPTPEEWAGDELRILPQSGNQYIVHMTCASEAVTSADHALAQQEPENTSSPQQGNDEMTATTIDAKIFYPKKIHAFVENFLSAEPMNSEVFARRWSQTRLSKNFWIEKGDMFIRIHVVPRRGLFDPEAWVTSQCDVKEKLLGSIWGG